jgi:hypothetical protein
MRTNWGEFAKKLARWKGNFLSPGDKLKMVNTLFSSVTMYIISFPEAPRGVIKK